MRLETGLRGDSPGRAHAGWMGFETARLIRETRTIATHPDHLPDGAYEDVHFGVSRVRSGAVDYIVKRWCRKS